MPLKIFGQQQQEQIAADIAHSEQVQQEMVAKVAALLAGHQRESVFAELIDTMRYSPDHACTSAAIAVLTLAEQQRRAD